MAVKLNDIDLNNIKVAIFDFDETLAIHKDTDFPEHRKESEEKFLTFYADAYKNPSIFYEQIEPCIRSEKLSNLINILRKENVKMYCLSGSKFSFHLKAKQLFINKYYGENIEVLSTSSQELKLTCTKIIQRINNCQLDEILFIDDRESVIQLLKDNGIKGITVDDIE